MRARTQRELVLLYLPDTGADDFAGAPLPRLLQSLRISCRQLTADDFGRTVAQVFTGAPGVAVTGDDAVPPAAPLMLMQGLERPRMDKLLQAMREHDLQVDLKAVVTPQNQRWPLCRLAGEIGREHQLMNAYFALQERYKALRAVSPQPESWAEPLARAETLLNTRPPEDGAEAHTRLLQQMADELASLQAGL
ncbi:DUF3783 domain-containing protein [Neobittarella massiliensis]|uniref:DUF3783 domain-containing protein n=1 Tax=Neobittarella massiliensis (ex Bilen et al. 2018) TaxID=2041842 RepID=UPI000CF65528|nr:DUF3783 domain-containing protein [Neobittarella massiliensis]